VKTKALAPLLPAPALAGCGRAPVTQAGAVGAEPCGRTFLSTSVHEEGEPWPLVPGTRIRLTFSAPGEHRLGTEAGCNSMGGAARFSGGRLLVDDLATIDMGCDPERPRRGTRWVVDSIIDGESVSSVPAGAEASITFEDNDRFGGSTGCNAMGGTAAVHEKTITFSDVITTKMACDPDRNRLERAVLSVLDGDVADRIEADRLTLNNPNGHGLGLRAAS